VSPRRYVVDTQLYIDALRNEEHKAALNAFHMEHTPFLHLSAVVAQELRAGVRGAPASRLERELIAPYERRGRLITPTYAAWKETGRVLSELISPAG
jgi:predicted nucleic acid-binding protein